MQIIYARGEQSTNFSSKKELYVNNCGMYRNLDEDICVFREKGRKERNMRKIFAISSIAWYTIWAL